MWCSVLQWQAWTGIYILKTTLPEAIQGISHLMSFSQLPYPVNLRKVNILTLETLPLICELQGERAEGKLRLLTLPQHFLYLLKNLLISKTKQTNKQESLKDHDLEDKPMS